MTTTSGGNGERVDIPSGGNNAGKNTVKERIRKWEKEANAADDDDDMSSMSQLFRNARGDRAVPTDYTSYQYDDDATIDSLSDVFGTKTASSANKRPLSASFNTKKSNVTTTSPIDHDTAKPDSLGNILRGVATVNDPVVEPNDVDEENAPVVGEEEEEEKSASAQSSSKDYPSPRSESTGKRQRMSNRMMCGIASIFVAVAALAIIIAFQVYYKKRSGGNTNSVETSPNSNLRSPSPTLSPIQQQAGYNIEPSTTTKTPVEAPPVPQLAQPTMKPTENYIDPLMEFLQDNQVYFEKDPMSPDFMAIQFLADEAQTRSTDGVSSAYGNGLEFNDKTIQRFAVLTLDFALNRPNASSANNVEDNAKAGIRKREVDECGWEGIVCADVGPTAGKVEEVRLSHSGMTGTIPPEINLLKNLKVLDLAGNELHGSIPESLYNIKELKELYLFQNHLTGTISNQIKNWYNITHLHLSHNELSGSIPITFKSGATIRPVEYLNLYSNQFTGTIPNLRFRRLLFADFGRNQFTGTLPDDIGQTWVELRFLFMDHNDFTGTIPTSYTTAGNGRVEILSFNHNRLTGYVPGGYEHFKLLQLSLHNNTFTGISSDTCKQSVFHSGEMVEFATECDICVCDPFCDRCDEKNKNNKNPK